MTGWDWWGALKLGCITVGVAALQVFKVMLLAANNEARSRGRRRLNDRGEYEEDDEKGFISGMSPEMRRALVDLIDHQITPVLVDQWRLGLVKVMLDPEEGPIIPDEDPQLRQALLDSIQSHQEAQDRRPTFNANADTSNMGFPNLDRRQNSSLRRNQQEDVGPSRPREPVLAALRNPDSTSSQPQASSSRQAYPPIFVGSEREKAKQKLNAEENMPSAPPLYPTVAHPSAPPLPEDDFEIVEKDAAISQDPPEREECGICMDAHVEVEINQCHHKLCCECAKAICCLEGRAPQCPFCRGAMRGVTALVS